MVLFQQDTCFLSESLVQYILLTTADARFIPLVYRSYPMWLTFALFLWRLHYRGNPLGHLFMHLHVSTS